MPLQHLTSVGYHHFISSLVVKGHGLVTRATEKRKQSKCKELGWACFPLVMETYGAWGSVAIGVFSTVASCMDECIFSIRQCWTYYDGLYLPSSAISDIIIDLK